MQSNRATMQMEVDEVAGWSVDWRLWPIGRTEIVENDLRPEFDAYEQEVLDHANAIQAKTVDRWANEEKRSMHSMQANFDVEYLLKKSKILKQNMLLVAN